jgi:type IV secretion system protein VirB3
MRELRRVPIHRGLIRVILFMGGERRLTLTVLIFLGVVLMSNTASITMWVVVIAMFMGAMWGLRKLAKRDPQFTTVYMRQMKYQAYYPPKRGVDAPQPKSKLD